jgi:hypothetical protein
LLTLLLATAQAGVVTWYNDADLDGFGDAGVTLVTDELAYPVGFVRDNTDCDDANVATNPQAIEVCNGGDNNCNGQVDEASCGCAWDVYSDRTYQFCTTDRSWTAAESTCVAIGYNLASLTDAAENDWAFSVAASVSATAWWMGANDRNTEGNWIWSDGSTWSFSPWGAYEPNNWYGNEDCGQLNWFATSVWNDGLCTDQRPYICESQNDPRWWYPDGDADGFGVNSGAIEAVAQPVGTVMDSSDCDDWSNQVFPGAVELCNSIDDDCNGQIDDNAIDLSTWYADLDGDGFGDPYSVILACHQPAAATSNGLDCDDSTDLVSPGAPEIPGNGIDDNCDGIDATGLGTGGTTTGAGTVTGTGTGTGTGAGTGTGTNSTTSSVVTITTTESNTDGGSDTGEPPPSGVERDYAPTPPPAEGPIGTASIPSYTCGCATKASTGAFSWPILLLLAIVRRRA